MKQITRVCLWVCREREKEIRGERSSLALITATKSEECVIMEVHPAPEQKHTEDCSL